MKSLGQHSRSLFAKLLASLLDKDSSATIPICHCPPEGRNCSEQGEPFTLQIPTITQTLKPRLVWHAGGEVELKAVGQTLHLVLQISFVFSCPVFYETTILASLLSDFWLEGAKRRGLREVRGRDIEAICSPCPLPSRPRTRQQLHSSAP